MAPEGGESVADVASRLAGVLSSTDVEFHGYFHLHYYWNPNDIFFYSCSVTCIWCYTITEIYINGLLKTMNINVS